MIDNTKFLYNNEAICLISLLAILDKIQQIEIGKLLLVPSFLLHNKIVKALTGKREFLSARDFITNEIESFVNFNDRFYSFLPLSLNTITLAEELKLITIDDNYIYFNSEVKFDLNNPSLGSRAKDIVKASNKLAKILQEDTKQLYFILRIEL